MFTNSDFEMGQDGPRNICGRKPLTSFKWYGLLRWTTSIQVFKGCLPQILLDPFMIVLNGVWSDHNR